MSKETPKEAQKAEESRLMPDKHGVIVIHGIGEQRKGDFVAEFAESLATTLIDTGGTVRVEADMHSDPAEVILHIKAPNGDEAVWVCREAYWADSFPPPSPRSVIGLIFQKHFGMFCRRLLAVIKSETDILGDVFNSRYIPGAEEANARTRLVSMRNVKDGRGLSFVYVGHAIIALFLPLIAAILTTLLLIYWLVGWFIGILGFLPFLKPIDFAVKWAQKNVDPFLSKSIGDLSQYVENTVWSASIRGSLEKAISKMLEEEFNNVTIIAHSMGCLVAYETLTKDSAVAAKVASIESRRGRRAKITLVTLGSALNLAFDIARQPQSLHARKRIDQPLAKEITGYASGKTDEALLKTFFWMDIYARLDPGPAGPLDDKITGGTNKETLSPRQVERRQVVNTDDLFRDHVSYWENKDEVMPRIAKAINANIYPWPSLKPSREKLVKRVNRAITRGNLRGLVLAAFVIGGVEFVLIGFGVVTGISSILILLLIDALAYFIARIFASYKNHRLTSVDNTR